MKFQGHRYLYGDSKLVVWSQSGDPFLLTTQPPSAIPSKNTSSVTFLLKFHFGAAKKQVLFWRHQQWDVQLHPDHREYLGNSRLLPGVFSSLDTWFSWEMTMWGRRVRVSWGLIHVVMHCLQECIQKNGEWHQNTKNCGYYIDIYKYQRSQI